MFSGLNRFIKFILPKRLFYRALIIVAAPTILLQLIVTIVFYDSIWIKANKNITRSLVAQLKAIQEVYGNDQKNLDFLTDSYKNNFNFEIGVSQELFPNKSGERKFSPMDRSLRRELKSAFGNNNYWFNTSKFKNAVEIKIKTEDGVLEFLVPKEMVSTSSVRLFVLWTTLPSFILIFIALIFLKNQTKPLVKLAKAAERFGKGDYVNDFRASGSLEIRKAAFEFDRMAKRINRHLNQRAEMLSGISHDLRTPLTRLKLQLAMIKQKDLSDKMSSDIDEMENMLNDYLQFAKTQTQETTSTVNLKDLFNSIKSQFDGQKLTINLKEEIKLVCRPLALKRSFENIIHNGLTYGKKVFVKVQKGNNRALIIIEDDGPGIPEDQYKNVFKPEALINQVLV